MQYHQILNCKYTIRTNKASQLMIKYTIHLPKTLLNYTKMALDFIKTTVRNTRHSQIILQGNNPSKMKEIIILCSLFNKDNVITDKEGKMQEKTQIVLL